jgi:hypothetical protein
MTASVILFLIQKQRQSKKAPKESPVFAEAEIEDSAVNLQSNFVSCNRKGRCAQPRLAQKIFLYNQYSFE